MADVILVGGGLTGGLLACALAEAGLELNVIDQINPHDPLPKDGRSFALSRSSYNVLKKLGIWGHLKSVTPITTIHTSDGVLPQWLEYHEEDVKGGPLGYVVDSALLKAKIREKTLSFKNVRVYAPASVEGLKRTASFACVKTDGGEKLKAALCVAADGKSSTLRNWAQIPLFKWSYDQVSIVCNMNHTLPHKNRAFEHFLPSGPLAFVPRPGKESGLIWSIEKDKADVLLNLSPEDFSEEVQENFGDTLGVLSLSSQRWNVPLSVCLPKRLVDTRFALVGDAAHNFHPVAGQGLNMGLRDVAALAEVLIEAASLGLDLGSSPVLNRYQRLRRMDILAMTLFTDGIVRVFSTQSPLVARFRSLGFGLTKHCPPLKKYMIQHAMGLAGRVPGLARD